MKYRMGERELAFGHDLLPLRDSSAAATQPEVLRDRLAEDGYLFLRGVHPREKVFEARRAILAFMDASGTAIRPGTELMDGEVNPEARPVRLMGNPAITHDPRVLAVLEGAPITDLFARLFGEPVRTFDYKWLRQIGPDGFTGAHFDNVYMGRGSKRLLTCWTPFGDIPMAQGTLCICRGSHTLPGFARMRETYGHVDVDRDHIDGWLSNDPVEITEKFGGQWHSADMRAGDIVIITMFTLHGSTSNTTNRWRLSCDTRFQPAADPVDERWVGASPKAHASRDQTPVKSMAAARAEWGL